MRDIDVMFRTLSTLSNISYFLACVFPALLSAEVFAFSARPSLSLSTKAVLDSAKDIRVLRNLSRGLNRAGEDSWNSIQSWNSKARSKKFSIAHHDRVWAVSFPHTYFHFHYSDMLVCVVPRVRLGVWTGVCSSHLTYKRRDQSLIEIF